MRNFLIISIIFSLILIFASSFVYASSVNMDLGSDSTVYGSQPVISDDQPSSSYDATISVGSAAGISESSLSLSNILNIILIVLGILLVLFAIAIMIRLH